MENKILLSIIIPTYNSLNKIKPLIKSLDEQEFNSGFEVIFVDSSNDETFSFLKNHFLNKNNFCVIKSDKKGVDFQRNIGIELSKGEYISFIDSDDNIGQHYIHKCLYLIKHKKADFYLFNFLWSDNGKYKKQIFHGEGLFPIDKEQLYELYYSSNYSMVMSSPWSKIYKKSLIGNIRFVGSAFEDSVFNFFYLQNVSEVFFSNYIAYIYHSSDIDVTLSSISKNKHSKYINIHLKQYRILRKEKNVSSFFPLYSAFNKYYTCISHMKINFFSFIYIKFNFLFSAIFDFRKDVVRIWLFAMFPILITFLYNKKNKFDTI